MDKGKLILFSKYFAVFVWLSLLIKTDSYYSIYLLIGILATIAIAKSKKDKSVNTWLEYLFASFFSLAVTLSNYPILINTIEPKPISVLITIFLTLIIFICGIIVFLHIISFARTLYLKTSKSQPDSPKNIFLISFLIFSLIDLFVFFTCCYPGSLTPDSIDEIGQILSGNYSNHHPFYFTMLIYPFIKIGLNLFHDINIGVALFSVFQILVLSTAFAYSISTLYRVGVSKKILIILAIGLALLPYNIIYSFTMWKDILFGTSFLFFIVTLYRYFNNLCPYKKSRLLQILLIFISGLVICLFRSNALFAIFISIILFFIIFKKKYLKLGIILILIVTSAFILKRPVLKAIDVNQPDIIESLSIPSQQIVKTLKYNKDQISEEDVALINNVADTDALIEAYKPTIHDPIKNVVRAQNNQEYLKEHAIDFISLYVKLGIEHPIQYLTAWIDITRGYWNGGYDFWIWANEVQVNDYGVERKGSTFFSELFSSYLEIFRKIPFLQPLTSIGLVVWILFLLLYRNLINKNPKIIFLLMAIITTWITLLIATPVFAEFRYIYFSFTCLPFLTIITIIDKPTLLPNKKKGANEKR